MTENNVLSKVVDIVTDAPATLNIDIKPTNKLHAWAQKYKLLPAKKTFKLYGARLGTMARISQAILEVKASEGEKTIEWAIEQVSKHADKAAYIIALAIHNRSGEPDKKLIDFIKNNLDGKDYHVCFAIVLEKLNISDFTTTIISTEKINILKKEEEVSPPVQKEIIASGESLEPLASIFGSATIM